MRPVVNTAVALIESYLQLTPYRDQFSADEVENLLLDLRTELVDEPVPV